MYILKAYKGAKDIKFEHKDTSLKNMVDKGVELVGSDKSIETCTITDVSSSKVIARISNKGDVLWYFKEDLVKDLQGIILDLDRVFPWEDCFKVIAYVDGRIVMRCNSERYKLFNIEKAPTILERLKKCVEKMVEITSNDITSITIPPKEFCDYSLFKMSLCWCRSDMGKNMVDVFANPFPLELD